MAETKDFLFELGTEELPPKSLAILSQALETQMVAGLAKEGLAHGAVCSYATPRRLALRVSDLASAQPDRTIERRGPVLSAAYQADGSPSKALEGFLRGLGATVADVSTLKTDKGEWVVVNQFVKGAHTVDLLPAIVTQSLGQLPIAKRMRWGNGTAEFVRPVHWAIMLFGGDVVKADILGVATDRISRGHRFHSEGPIVIDDAAGYAAKLLEQGHVMADFAARRDKIRGLAQEAAAGVRGLAHIEDELLDEVTALVEWPVPVVGGFDDQYLALPPEVLITTMQANQKYFPVKDSKGNLLPYFITFSNLDSSNLATVKAGNERVVRPRLADAEFFWNQDRKRTLESRVNDLAQITFQKTLGSLLDKARRVQNLAAEIAGKLGDDSALSVRAAGLAKADLLTSMVGEFPELQGTMGRYYALAEGEPEEIASAIEEQYLPKQSGGALPETRVGLIVALAEKLDTLTGIFSAGLIPSGDKDPYALRRAALGAIRIFIERRLDLDVPELLDFALDQFGHEFDSEKVRESVHGFMLERLRGYCLDHGYQHDEFEAVLAVWPSSLVDFERRLKAVQEFRKLPEAESLAAANKRIRNILKKAEELTVANVDDLKLSDPAENKLLDQVRSARHDILPMLNQGDYTSALCRLAGLRETVDGFFDEVMVMTEDAELRRNRLGLLAIVESLFLDIADISKLQG